MCLDGFHEFFECLSKRDVFARDERSIDTHIEIKKVAGQCFINFVRISSSYANYHVAPIVNSVMSITESMYLFPINCKYQGPTLIWKRIIFG